MLSHAAGKSLLLLRCLALLLAVPLAALLTVQPAVSRAADPAGPAAASGAALDPQSLLSAVVQVKMKALPGARSASTLGAERDGSGVIIDGEGHILTIGYIVSEADSINIVTSDGKTVSAVLLAYDHASGVGLLKSSLPLAAKPMPLGKSEGLALREPVMILPAGGAELASVAYVMSKRSFAGGWEYLLDTAIFTSPPTLQWSGAALVNRRGELVGIGSLLVRDAVESGSPLPGNMFVPIDTVKPVLAELIAQGRRSGPPRPWLGLSTEELEGRLFVTRVSPGGPADQAGLRHGDIVLAVGGDKVGSMEEFYRKVWATGAAGVDVPLRVLQGPDMKDIRVHTMDRVEYFKEKPAT